MNRVQELIDEHKSEMPTMLAKQLLDACKEEYDCTTKLYRIVVTKVTSVTYTEYSDDEIEAHCKLQSSTQEVIVEPVEMSEVRQMKTCSTLKKGGKRAPLVKNVEYATGTASGAKSGYGARIL